MNNELVVKAGTKIRSLDENVLREMVVTADIPVCVVGELTASLDNSGQVNKHIVFKGLQGFDREKLFCMLKLIPLQLPVGVSVVDFCPGHAYCESCGECVFCTYPHTCCCGKCGWLCLMGTCAWR